MWKVQWWEFTDKFKRDVLRAQHCNKGYHYLAKQVQQVTEYRDDKKRTKRVEYLKCRDCPYLFFSNLKDKQTYLALNNSHRKIQKLAIKVMLKNVRGKKYGLG